MFSIFRHISERPILCELIAPLWGKMPVGRKGVFFLLFLFLPLFSYAQNRVVSGTVSDDMGPIMMANVVERDANNRIVSACQTDVNGNFSMEIKSGKNKLVVSFVGDKTKTLPIGDTETFDIVLEPESTTLQEVTVKATRTGSGGLFIPMGVVRNRAEPQRILLRSDHAEALSSHITLLSASSPVRSLPNVRLKSAKRYTKNFWTISTSSC